MQQQQQQQQHHHHTAMDNTDLFQFLAAGGTDNSASLFSTAAPPYGSVAEATASSMMMMMMQHSSFSSSSSYYPLELSEITDNNNNNHSNNAPSQRDRALAAMRNHKEAEKRRRERINSHLARLRTLLPCNSKTDKASLLAKVVQRVKELKQQTSEITDLETVPSETDEITVLSSAGGDYGGDGRLIFKASLCCEDRSDLIPELIEILNSLHLKTLRAEMATLGGRTRNVLVVAAEKEHSIESIHFLQNSLKSLIERSNSSSDRSKRRRGLDRRFTA